jgi:hypothetical protein
VLVAAVMIGLLASTASAQTPPYSGTIFNDPDIITASDPTLFRTITYAGRGKREVFDRRKDRFVTINAYLFNATYSDGLKIEAQVNPEFGSRTIARARARKYAIVVGRLPRVQRVEIRMLWIHKGKQPFGGGVRHLLIHTGQSGEYERDGILEETLVHEAAHTALDGKHAAARGWLAAQRADPTFISTYAQDNPTREDIAESFLPWLALRYRRDRIDAAYADTVQQAIPNRLAYFDARRFNVAPITQPQSAP